MSKKQEIFEQAAILFQEKGYGAASMRDLAERVQLKASSLYSHIRRKEEILEKICSDQALRFIEAMAVVEKLDASAAKKVEALLALHIRTALEDPTSITVFNDEWKHLEEPYLGEFLERRREYEQRFREIIRKGIEAGDFRPIDPNTAVNTLLTSIRWLHYRQYSRSPEETGKLEKEVIALLMGGLKESF